MNFLRVIKNIFIFRNNNEKKLENTSSNDLIIKNNYGVEKNIYLPYYITNIYFIPSIYIKGTFKLKDLPCLIYSVEEFKNLPFNEKEALFEKNSFWYTTTKNSFSNGFNILYGKADVSIDNIEVTYIDLENQKGILNRVSLPNSDYFFQYFEKDSPEIDSILKKLSKEASESIFKYIETNFKKEEIFRMFLEYYGDGELADIVFTIGTKKEYIDICQKYLTEKYLDSFGMTVEEMEESLKCSAGDYSQKFVVSNIDEINSYYCSFQECGIVFEGTHTDENNNFLYLLGMLIKKDLEKKIDKFNLTEDFVFIEPTIYD